MKLKLTLCFVSLFFIAHNLLAIEKSIPDTLQINETQTLILKFATKIKYVDFGNADLIGEKLSSETMLSIKSSTVNFKSTTISIVTADSKYYTFKVCYNKTLPYMAYDISNSKINTQIIELSSLKTTHFIANNKVTDIVLGSEDLYAGYADGIENIVRAKAANSKFNSTSISFVCSDLSIHTFLVLPNDSTNNLSVYLNGQSDSTKAIFEKDQVNETLLNEYAQKVVDKGIKYNSIGILSQKMAFSMVSLFSIDDFLIFRLCLDNNNAIDYEIDFLKVYIKDSKTSDKTAQQETEIFPFYTYYPNNTDKHLLKAKSQMSSVLFFKRFTIPKNRVLYFEVFEKNGGRHLKFEVSDKQLLKAKLLD